MTDVLLIDHHPITHHTLGRVVCTAMPGAAVHAETTLAAGLERARRLPDLALVLLDLDLPGYSGIEALTRLHNAFPGLRVVVVCATDDAHTLEAAIRAGTAGWRSLASLGLTERQTDVLRLLVKAIAYRDIARKLGIAENTVKQHAHAAYRTLGVASRNAALLALARLGLRFD